MTAAEIAELCIESADKYYCYLEAQRLGVVRIPVKSKQCVEGMIWKLVLRFGLHDPETVVLRNTVNDRIFSNTEFEVIEYDEETKALILKFRSETPEFDDASENQLEVISDLKFLVRNVRDWFLRNGHQLAFPAPAPGVASAFKPVLPLNEDQTHAVNTVLSRPYCYIWGPPGTGKTRHVLAQAVIHYVRQGQMVAVLAPTNDALEAILRPLLEICQKLADSPELSATERDNLKRERFLRVGSPSRGFAADFPEVCEVQGIQRQIAAAERQLELLKKVITYRRGQNALNSITALLREIDALRQSLSHRDALLVQHARDRSEIARLEGQLKSPISKLRRWIGDGNQQMKTLIAEKLTTLENLARNLGDSENAIELHLAKIQRVTTGSQPIDNEIQQLNFANLNDVQARLNDIRGRTFQYLAVRVTLDQEYTGFDVKALEARLAAQESEIARLRRTTTEERLQHVNLIGMTLDGFIGRFRENCPVFNHAFLDEAAYAPLIKGLTLFRRNTPVTFLGDHMQLPPVCEMKKVDLKRPENKPVRRWSASSLFVNLIFDSDSPAEALEVVATSTTPKTDCTLKRTHRFGSNLAEILDRLIYRFGFTSADDSKEQITLRVISVPTAQEGSGRANLDECLAIQNLLEETQFSSYAILAPYRDQIALLGQHLPEQRQNNLILTVHKSQGREWDTVIFSATDIAWRRPYYTDTAQPESVGRLVLNTAVSRTKKELVLVCDVDYWHQRHDRDRQLLSQLAEGALI